MSKYTVVTNNTGLEADIFPDANIERVKGGPEAVYTRLEALLKSGHRLISSPLPVNVPLIRSFVRSVIIEKSEISCDYEGLMLVKSAARRSEILGINREQRVRADLEMIDMDQLAHAIRDLKELCL